MTTSALKAHRRRGLIAVLLALVAGLASVIAAPSATAAPPAGPAVPSSVAVGADVTADAADGGADVLVQIDASVGTAAITATDRTGATAAMRTAAVANAAADYTAVKKRVLAAAGTGVKVKRQYSSLPVTLLHVANTAALARLAGAPGVTAITLPKRHKVSADPGLSLVKQPEAEFTGFTGAGVSVAVIDTGVDWLRPGVGDAFGNCSAGPGTGTCRIDHLIDITGTGMRDPHTFGHGTNVSAIVAKTAPDAHLEVYGVFQADGETSTDVEVLAAVDHLTANGPARGVRAVNLSLGNEDVRNTTQCQNSVFAGPFTNLRALGILPVVSAGNAAAPNSTFSPGVADPACVPGALSVGAAYPSASNQVFDYGICTDTAPAQASPACFSQTFAALSIFAPGVGITAAGITMSGTSQAAPHVAGAVADVVSANRAATAQQVAKALTGTGRPVTDARSGFTTNLLDIAAASLAVQTPDAGIDDAGCTTNRLSQGDDLATGSVALPFAVNYFGTTYRDLFVTTNGTVTFRAAPTEFVQLQSAAGLPTIAPFAADVDTTNTGTVSYGMATFGSRPAFCVNWSRVGYYAAKANKANSFQLLVVDRSDVAVGDVDVVLNYDALNWETGDSPGASNGENGTPASAGYTAADGDATRFFRLPGSAVHTGLLDYNSQTGLVNRSLGSLQPGRYLLPFRGGAAPGRATIAGLVQSSAGVRQPAAPVQACPTGGGSCTVSFTGADGRYTILGLPGGTYTVSAGPPAGSTLKADNEGPVSVSGAATATANLTLTAGSTGMYVDAAGAVRDTANNLVSGASVRLFRSDTATGPFTEVADGSPILATGSRTAPQTTAAPGTFRFPVLAGYYQVAASKAGCAQPGTGASLARSAVRQVPVTTTDLTVVLDCTVSPPGGSFVPVTPARIADTRQGLGYPAKLGRDESADLQVTGRGGVPASGVAAVVLNVTVTEPTAPGNLAVYPAGIPLPGVSNVNFEAGETAPNLVMVPVSADGRIRVTNKSTGSSHVVVDVAGYYRSGTPSAAGAFSALTPARIVDTRSALGWPGKLGRDDSAVVQVTGRGGVPGSGVSAVVLNVTATEPTTAGNIEVFPTGVASPGISSVNFVTGQSVPNLVTVPVGPDGRIVLTNHSVGSTHVVVDVAGYFLAGGPVVGGAFTPVTPARITDTRLGLGWPTALRRDGSAILQVTGRGGIPASGVAAVVLNVTATGPTADGNLAVYPSGVPAPTVSNLNFVTGESVPNLVVVPVGGTARAGSAGTIVVTNHSVGTTHFIVDVAGYVLS